MNMKYVKEIKKERLEQVREMYSQNMRVTEIAKALGCGSSTVSGYIAELGIRRDTTDRTEFENEIIRLHEEGLNGPQIGNKVGLSQSSVNKILRKHGLGRHRVNAKDIMENLNLKYAKDYSNVVLEKIMIDGKWYTDITPIFSPRQKGLNYERFL